MGNVSLKVLEKSLNFFVQKRVRTMRVDPPAFRILVFIVPFLKKNTEGGPTFNVRTIRNWNELSADVKKSNTVKSFENKLYTTREKY